MEVYFTQETQEAVVFCCRLHSSGFIAAPSVGGMRCVRAGSTARSILGRWSCFSRERGGVRYLRLHGSLTFRWPFHAPMPLATTHSARMATPHGAINTHDSAPSWHPWRHSQRRLHRAIHLWHCGPTRRTIVIAAAESATNHTLMARLLRYTREYPHRSMVATADALRLQVRGRNLHVRTASWANMA